MNPNGLVFAASITSYARTRRREALVRRRFEQHLAPAVVRRMIEEPQLVKLGGERRELTIFFSDLQGFSAISERLPPEELTRLLNDYLSLMTEIILAEGGTLDKYVGDAIVAFWNAPLAQPDHAVRAVRAALRCQRALAEQQADYAQRIGGPLKMRIGINTGAVVVGNMGSRQRFDYTMLGDAANLASRLEGANKAFGTHLMLAESTWQQTAGAFIGRELAQLTVVGRKTPVRVFEATGLAAEPLADDTRAFTAALALVHAGDWAAAAAGFAALAADPAAQVYAAKCRELAANPAATWDGIWNLTEK